MEVCRSLDLSERAIFTHHRGQLAPRDLERHSALMAQIVCQVDRRHTTVIELALDAVAALEGCVQATGVIGRGAKSVRGASDRLGDSHRVRGLSNGLGILLTRAMR